MQDKHNNMEQKELQEKIELYKQLEEYLQSLATQQALISQRLKEIEATEQSIENMQQVFHATLGSGVFLKVERKDNKYMVAIARDLLIEMDENEIKEFLKEKKEKLSSTLEQINQEIQAIRYQMEEIAKEVNKALGAK